MLETERLVLRRWTAADREPFARINADPEVARYLSRRLTREQSDAFVDRIEAQWRERGFGLYAVEVRKGAAFAGFIGLSVPPFDAAFTPCVEIGWRIAPEHWNLGYATEGARAVVGHAFGILRMPALVSFTTVENRPSRRVMEKLAMTHDPAEDFDHPLLPQGHPLRPHVLYRLSAPPGYSSSVVTSPNS